jgi:hypothetical protein
MVGLVRIELTTSPLSGVRSSQLSYRPSLLDIPINLIRVSGQRAPTSASLNARAKQHHREALILKRFEDKLNVRTGYAGADHHAETFGRDSSSEAPVSSVRDRRSGVHGNIPRNTLVLANAGGRRSPGA